ncbi:MAG: hypothetical protein U0174_08490 [Polyangiaceae bacterium]
MTTRAEDDMIMLVVGCGLGVLAVAGIVASIVLFVKKKVLLGAVILTIAIVLGLLAGGTLVLLALSKLAWH